MATCSKLPFNGTTHEPATPLWSDAFGNGAAFAIAVARGGRLTRPRCEDPMGPRGVPGGCCECLFLPFFRFIVVLVASRPTDAPPLESCESEHAETVSCVGDFHTAETKKRLSLSADVVTSHSSGNRTLSSRHLSHPNSALMVSATSIAERMAPSM